MKTAKLWTSLGLLIGPMLVSASLQGAEDWQRTVLLVEGETKTVRKCSYRAESTRSLASRTAVIAADPFQCALPIRYNNLKNNLQGWKSGDFYLDWYGAESGQGSEAMGSKPDWTTDQWPADWGEPKSVDADGFGVSSLNTYGPHYWQLDVMMDCNKAVASGGSRWFGLKRLSAILIPGKGTSPNAPFPSRNHIAQCGKINVFKMDQDEPVAFKDFGKIPSKGSLSGSTLKNHKPGTKPSLATICSRMVKKMVPIRN